VFTGFSSRIIFPRVFLSSYCSTVSITSIFLVVVARGIIDSCQMSSSGVAYSGWIGPNTDVSLFTDLDTRKIEPIMCRNFVILLLWFLSGAGSVGLLGCDGCELGCFSGTMLVNSFFSSLQLLGHSVLYYTQRLVLATTVRRFGCG
jgi:hypothetical protein